MAENACSLPATHYSLLHSEFLVRDRAFGGAADELGVFGEDTAGFARSTGLVRLHSRGVFGFGQAEFGHAL